MKLQAIVDTHAIQSLMDDFHALARIPMSILDLDGRVLAGAGGQDICTKFHRVHPDTCKNCLETDKSRAEADIAPGEMRIHRCGNDMWEVATPLMAGDRHAGHIVSGQFFFDDEDVDYELFRARARRCGFDEGDYFSALDRVPRLNRQAVAAGMRFLTKLAQVLSQHIRSDFQLHESQSERDELTRSLAGSEARLKKAQEIARLGSWGLDLATNELTWSDEVYRIFGLEPKEFGASYEAFLDAVHPDDRAAVDAAYSSSIREGRDSYEITHRVVRKCSGEVRWAHEKCEHVRDEAGRVVRSVGMVQDITEGRRAEEQLRAAHAELSVIHANAPAALFVVDEELRIRKANDAAAKFAGRDIQKMIGFPPGEAIGCRNALDSPDGCGFGEACGHCALRAAALDSLRNNARHDNVEAWFPLGEGGGVERRCLLISTAPLELPAGRRVLVCALDITKRKRAEQALSDSEAQFRTLTESIPDLVWTAGGDGNIDYYNQRWTSFTGLSQEQLGQSGLRALVHPMDRAGWDERWSECVSSGAPFEMEARLLGRGGEWRWILCRALPLCAGGDRAVKWFGAIADVDLQKRTMDVLRQANRRLERANEDLRQYAYAASHDLQEPLRMVTTFTQLLSRKCRHLLDEDAQSFIDFSVEGAVRLQALIEDLRRYWEVTESSGKVRETVDLNRAVADAVASLSVPISESGAEVHWDPLPNVLAAALPLTQVLQNLLSNAIKYRDPDRPPRILVSADRDGPCWRVSVKDNGIGIEPEYRRQIFNLFKRLHPRSRYPGNGMGLAICQRVVESYGGRIWVESTPGEGSTFRFTLPDGS